MKTFLLAAALLIASTLPASAQLASFPAQSFTATGQTGATITLAGTPGTFSSGTIAVSGTITTVTFAVQGSNDGGATWYALPTAAIATPGTLVATQTAIAPGLYVVNLASITNVRVVTSGTFTATGAVTIKLTGSNAHGLL